MEKTWHFIWIGNKPIPKEFILCIYSITSKLEPLGFDIKFWDNNSCESRINNLRSQSNLVNHHIKNGNYALVVDLLRLEVLHEYGGFYSDVDIYSYNLDLFHYVSADKLNYSHGDVNLNPTYALMYSNKHNPILKILVDYLLKDSEFKLLMYYLKVCESAYKNQINIWPRKLTLPYGYSMSANINISHKIGDRSFNHLFSSRSWII